MKTNENAGPGANSDADRSRGAFSPGCRTSAVEFGGGHYGAPSELKAA
jgi:hypothetical protein